MSLTISCLILFSVNYCALGRRLASNRSTDSATIGTTSSRGLHHVSTQRKLKSGRAAADGSDREAHPWRRFRMRRSLLEKVAVVSPSHMCKILPSSENESTIHLSVDGRNGANVRMLAMTKTINTPDIQGDMATVNCKGSLPAECKVPLVVAHAATQCPNCPCEQDTSVAFDYIQKTKTFIAADCDSRRGRRLLHVGLGLGTLTTAINEACPNSINDVVELDARLVHAARHFAGAKFDGTNIGSCDRVLREKVEQGSDKYDFIILDTFDETGEIPAVCRDEKFASSAFALLHDRGCVLMNHWYEDEGGHHAQASPIFDKLFGIGCEQDVDNIDEPGQVLSIWCKGDTKPKCDVSKSIRLSLLDHSERSMASSFPRLLFAVVALMYAIDY